ncbi:hypothetical protein QZN11_34470 [Streptomyces gramineus]|uniref:hypothetical protein n=1 Tax=Streptomyces gramineus TaxID=910542 RepID=UPI00398A8261
MSPSEHREAGDEIPAASGEGMSAEQSSGERQGAAPTARPPAPRRVPGAAGRRQVPQDLADHRPDMAVLLRVKAGLKRLV